MVCVLQWIYAYTVLLHVAWHASAFPLLPARIRLPEESDVKEVSKQQAASKTSKEAMNEVAEVIRKHQGDKPKVKRARRGVRFASLQNLSREDAQSLLPDKYKIFRDEFNGRWRVCTTAGATTWSTSKSWGVSGDDGPCVKHCLKEAWARYTLLTGGECPFNLDFA